MWVGRALLGRSPAQLGTLIGFSLTFTVGKAGLSAYPTPHSLNGTNSKARVCVQADGMVRVETGTEIQLLRQVHPGISSGPETFQPAGANSTPYPGCLVCHGNIENITARMGFNLDCTFCHGGDPGAIEKDRAHVDPVCR